MPEDASRVQLLGREVDVSDVGNDKHAKKKKKEKKDSDQLIKNGLIKK